VAEIIRTNRNFQQEQLIQKQVIRSLDNPSNCNLMSVQLWQRALKLYALRKYLTPFTGSWPIQIAQKRYHTSLHFRNFLLSLTSSSQIQRLTVGLQWPYNLVHKFAEAENVSVCRGFTRLRMCQGGGMILVVRWAVGWLTPSVPRTQINIRFLYINRKKSAW
jgi:hypothetical protein